MTASFGRNEKQCSGDAFSIPGLTFWLKRDPLGKIDNLHVDASRMRDMPFARVSR